MTIPDPATATTAYERQPDEAVEDWERMLEKIDPHEHVALTRYDDDSVGIRWNLAETGA